MFLPRAISSQLGLGSKHMFKQLLSILYTKHAYTYKIFENCKNVEELNFKPWKPLKKMKNKQLFLYLLDIKPVDLV